MYSRGSVVGPRWSVLLLGLVMGCSEPGAPETSVSPLLSTSLSTTSGEATLSADLSTFSPKGESSVEPSSSPSGASEAPPDPSTHDADPFDAAVSEVTEADARLPPSNESPPRESGSQANEQACGIPIDNGPALCDPVAQCGCDIDQMCAFTPDRDRRFSCVRPGSKPVGDACDKDDECVSGSVCVAGLCATTCRLDTDCDQALCVPVNHNEETVEGLRVCEETCDPMSLDACGMDATCANALGSASFTCVRQATKGSSDMPCVTSRECATGLGCAPDGVCRAWCHLDQSVGDGVDAGADAGSVAVRCPTFSECLPFDASANLGLCGPVCPVPDVAGSECAVLPTTCGCKAGATCHVSASGQTQCAQTGQVDAMSYCTQNRDCADGLSCIGSLCRPVCDAQAAPCADGSICAKTSSNPASPSACLGHCDPVNPGLDDDEFTPCGTGAYCSPGLPANPTAPESYCTGQLTSIADDGDPCEIDFGCKNGSGCDPDTKRCEPWCREQDDCPSGAKCVLELSPERSGADGSRVGFCR